MNKYGKGWFLESERHRLARLGVATGRKDYARKSQGLGHIFEKGHKFDTGLIIHQPKIPLEFISSEIAVRILSGKRYGKDYKADELIKEYNIEEKDMKKVIELAEKRVKEQLKKIHFSKSTKYKYLSELPTLAVGQADDLKIDTGKKRVWVSRVDGSVSVEVLKDGKWILSYDEIDYSKSSDKIKGGLSDNMPDSMFDSKQIEKGIKVELEHTSNKSIAKEIVKDHLSENPKYYDYLEKMEKKFNIERAKKRRKRKQTGIYIPNTEKVDYSKEKYVYWMEDKDDPSIEFEGSVSTDINETKEYMKDFDKRIPGGKFIIRKQKLSELKKSNIDYQQEVTYSPITLDEEHKKRLEKGWLKRGLEKEREFGKKVIGGVGKVSRGFLSTVMTGLAPEEERAVSQPRVMVPMNYSKDNTQKQISDILYKPKKDAKDREVLTIEIPRKKEKHLKFLKTYTKFNTKGRWKGKEEKNIQAEIEFKDSKNERYGKMLMKLFNKLNKDKVKEKLLYVRTEPVDESSLNYAKKKLEVIKIIPANRKFDKKMSFGWGVYEGNKLLTHTRTKIEAQARLKKIRFGKELGYI